jgi:hypothetical protein
VNRRRATGKQSGFFQSVHDTGKKTISSAQ